MAHTGQSLGEDLVADYGKYNDSISENCRRLWERCTDEERAIVRRHMNYIDDQLGAWTQAVPGQISGALSCLAPGVDALTGGISESRVNYWDSEAQDEVYDGCIRGSEVLGVLFTLMGLVPMPADDIAAFSLAAGASEAEASQIATTGRSLLAGSSPRVIANALEPHEIAQAQQIVGYRGGTFVGNQVSRQPGIDGFMNGTPASMKTYGGQSPSGVLRRASQAETQLANAGYSGAEVYINAPGVSMSSLLDFAPSGGLALIPSQGTVTVIYVLTSGGWVVLV